MSENSLDPIIALLEQLQRYTEQIACCEHDDSVDVAALTRACEDRLAALQSALTPAMVESKSMGGAKATSNGPSDLEDRMRALEAQTRRCIEILSRRRDEAESSLLSLRHAQRAVRAYRG